MKEKFENLSKLIGNTPLIRIDYSYFGVFYSAFCKLEYYSLTGSIKDRAVYQMCLDAYNNGILKEGMEIVEVTSGNTGISFAGIGRYLNCPVTIFMPSYMTKERIQLLESYNANVKLIDGDFKKCQKEAIAYVESHKALYLNQFSNLSNMKAHYQTTAKEIDNKLKAYNYSFDSFVAGLGTGGTIMGIGSYLKHLNKDNKLYSIEPLESSLLINKVENNKHRIYGISDGFIPQLVDTSIIDGSFAISDADAIIMAQKLAKELGLGVGISSGANFIGTVIANSKNLNKNVVTVFSDDNKKYLSTDYSANITMQDDYYSKNIKLLGYKVLN